MRKKKKRVSTSVTHSFLSKLSYSTNVSEYFDDKGTEISLDQGCYQRPQW